MNTSRYRLAYSFALAFTALFPAQLTRADLFMSKNGEVSKGNKLLAEKKPAEALEAYDAAARALPSSPAVHLNRGLALSRMGAEQADQAMQALQLASDGSAPSDVRARALGNLGNAFFKKEDFEKAVELYKQSLSLVPSNKDIAWNFELARQKKKEKDEQKKKEEEQKKQDQQNQDQQNQDQQNKDQQNQDQQNKDQQKQDQQKQEQQKQEQNPAEQQKKQEQQPQPKTKQEMEQVLESLDNQPDNVRKEMARQKGAMVPAGPFKDW